MCVYVYSGKDLYRLESALRDKIRKLHIDKDHIVEMDADNRKTFQMEKMLMECDTFSLFDGSASKAVIVRNPWFLNASAKGPKETAKKAKKDSPDALEQYLKRPNPTTELFFYCHGFDPDSRKKEYRLLKNNDAVFVNFQLMKEKEFSAYAAEQCRKKGLTLDRDALQELVQRSSLDTLLLHQNIEKLDLYGEKHPSAETVEKLAGESEEVDAFRLSNQFASGNLDEVLKTYRKMLRRNEPVPRMISLLAGSLRRLYNMRLLYEEGLGEREIASRLHFRNEWAVHYGLQNAYGVSSDTLLRWLKELADLDQGIKAGTIEQISGFEDFLIRNGDRHAGYTRTL